MIKVLLLEEIHKVGGIGDVVSVKSGFARNFLIPAGKAMRVTPEAVKVFEAKKADLLRQHEEKIAATRKVGEKLHRMRLSVPAHASPDGKLYGSIGPSVVAQELVRHVPEADGILRNNQVRIPGGNVKNVGDFDVAVSLTKDIRAEIVLSVLADDSGGQSSFGAIPEAPAPAPVAPEAAADSGDGAQAEPEATQPADEPKEATT